jgi:hypothetical protein
VVLSSRLMEVKLPSNLPAAALMKSGCAGATGVGSFSLPIPTLVELHVGRPTDSRLLSILSILTWTSLSSILRAARLVGLPANHRATSYQVGRETSIGYILRQIALAVTRYGKCRRQVDPTRVFDLENAPARRAPGLAISPDKRTILYTQLDVLNSDTILVENFR